MRTARALGGLGIAAATLGTYAVALEPRWVALREFALPVLRPAARGGLLVAHISDLHLWPRHDHIARALERIARADPDVVVATGDLLGHPGVTDDVVALLGRLGAGRAALAVLGSNDHFGPVPKNPLRYFRPHDPHAAVEGAPLETARLVAGLEDAGWQFVDNRATRVQTAAGPVDVRGVGDAHKNLHRLEAVDRPAGEDAALALGVTHAPYTEVLERMQLAGLDLALAGHTHGGQVRLPGVGALVDNCDLPLSQARGVSGRGALTLHVSAGLGQSRYAPFRFACRPEASLLHLSRRL